MENAHRDMEWIVREVLRRLGQNAPKQQASDELWVDARVVSTAVVDGRLESVNALVVRGDAVVTPLVLDELRSRNVALRRNGSEARSGELVVAVAESAYEPRSLLERLKSSGVACRRLPQSALSSVVKAIANSASENSKDLLITDNLPAAICLANRHEALRAASAATVQEVQDAVRLIAANVLVVKPGKQSEYHLRRMAHEFSFAGSR